MFKIGTYYENESNYFTIVNIVDIGTLKAANGKQKRKKI